MKILVACEESQAVTIAFRKLGIEVYSNDIIDCSGDHPEWHLQMYVKEALNLREWSAMIAFPPCTHLSSSGAKWFEEKRREEKRREEKRREEKRSKVSTFYVLS